MGWFSRLMDKRKLERELKKELQYHLDRQQTDCMQAGPSGAQARRQANLHFGGRDRLPNSAATHVERSGWNRPFGMFG